MLDVVQSIYLRMTGIQHVVHYIPLPNRPIHCTKSFKAILEDDISRKLVLPLIDSWSDKLSDFPK